MKKFALLLIIAFLSLSSIAQEKPVYFTLSPEGFVAEDGKNFCVLVYDGLTQAELFDVFLAKLTLLYVSPNDVISSVPNTVISVNGIAKDVVQITAAKAATRYSLNYTLSFEFKDGKVRINAPALNGNQGEIAKAPNRAVIYLKGENSGIAGINSVYNKEGELKKEVAKTDLENYFNKYLADLHKSIDISKAESW